MTADGVAASLGPTATAISEAVLAAAAERSVEGVLDRLVHAARRLGGARYAAIGVPDDHDPTAFAQFVTAGMSDELIEELGDLPRTHGLLGAALVDRRPFRSDDITLDPRFRGWWPAAHPTMRSFLGVPIVRQDRVLAAFYLTDKEGAPTFDDHDQQIVELLAAHAALAIEHAQLHEAARERSIADERGRLARELHDSLNQLLFGLRLDADAARASLPADPDAAIGLLADIGDLAGRAQRELRTLVQGLRPPDLDADGLVGTLAKRSELLARAYGVAVDVVADETGRRAADELDPLVEREAYRVAQEALSNALRHAAPSRITVSVASVTAAAEAGPGRGELVVAVTDDGDGFDVASARGRGRHLGLVTMDERAAAIGGRLSVDSEPGRGTTVTLAVPRG